MGEYLTFEHFPRTVRVSAHRLSVICLILSVVVGKGNYAVLDETIFIQGFGGVFVAPRRPILSQIVHFTPHSFLKETQIDIFLKLSLVLGISHHEIDHVLLCERLNKVVEVLLVFLLVSINIEVFYGVGHVILQETA